MEKNLKTVSFKKNAGILLGIAVAFTILFSQSFYYSINYTTSVELKDTNNKKSDNKHEVISTANDLLSTVAQLNIVKFGSFIIEIPFNDGVSITKLKPETADYNSYFRTLFRQIISPNAP